MPECAVNAAARVTLLVLAVLLAGSCMDGRSPSEPIYLRIMPDSLEVLEGTTARYRAVTNISPNQRGLVYWLLAEVEHMEGFSTNQLLAAPTRVSALDGTVTDVFTYVPGRAKIVAHFSHIEVADTAILVVLHDPLGSVEVWPEAVSIRVGESADLRAASRSLRDRDLPRHEVDWEVSDLTVASLSVSTGNGASPGYARLTGLAVGSIEVTATVRPEGVSGTATVVVLEAEGSPAALEPAPLAVGPPPALRR
jgi:hypothetical protein